MDVALVQTMGQGNGLTATLLAMGNYRDLTVWKRAHTLALEVYRCTASFPNRERYALAAQLRRAAISVVSNIAEGEGRLSDRELARFLKIARGSVREIECQLLLARDLGYVSAERWANLDRDAQTISKMLNRLVRSLQLAEPSFVHPTRDS
jgi:four helix bundle protein